MFFLVSFTKSENKRMEQVMPRVWEEVGTSGRVEVVEKGCKRVNMVQILCTYVCKFKNDTC
jgi:hypothetical protein